MRNILKLLFVAVVGCSVTSCKDFLNPEPVDNYVTGNFYQTDDQVLAALTPLYYRLRNSPHGANYRLQFNGLSDEAYYYSGSTESNITFSQTSTNSYALAFWTANYAGLKDAAYLLEGIEENKETLSEEVYNKAKGEALFFRGYFHFLLAQWYCHPSTGIPMYMETPKSYDETSMPITKLADIYDQIIEDMEAAAVLLQDQTWASLGYSERVTVNTCHGLLARVCLFAAGWPNEGGNMGTEYYYTKALANCKTVESFGHTLAESYSDIFAAQSANEYISENIWEIGYSYGGSTTEDSATNTAGSIGSVLSMDRTGTDVETEENLWDSLLSQGRFYIMPSLYALYGFGDDRRDRNAPNFIYQDWSFYKQPICITSSLGTPVTDLLPTGQMWAKPSGKWRREEEERVTGLTANGGTGTNFPLLRYADVLLMAAEALIELGRPAEAAPYINQVRYRSVPNIEPTKIVEKIYSTNGSSQDRGYAHVPEFTEDTIGSGTGFVPFAMCARAATGVLYTGVWKRGSGYDVAPVISFATGRDQTWQPNTYYRAGTYVTVNNDTYTQLYYANTSGTSTSVAPTFILGALSETTSPTLEEAETEQGLQWDYQNRYATAGATPPLTCYTETSIAADVSALVDINNQSAMRDFVRDERARELCFENLRRMDLKRWHILVETIKEMYEISQGSKSSEGIPAGTGSVITNAQDYIDEYDYYLPIPSTQLPLNTNLIQNPGY